MLVSPFEAKPLTEVYFAAPASDLVGCFVALVSDYSERLFYIWRLVETSDTKTGSCQTQKIWFVEKRLALSGTVPPRRQHYPGLAKLNNTKLLSPPRRQIAPRQQLPESVINEPNPFG